MGTTGGAVACGFAGEPPAMGAGSDELSGIRGGELALAWEPKLSRLTEPPLLRTGLPGGEPCPAVSTTSSTSAPNEPGNLEGNGLGGRAAYGLLGGGDALFAFDGEVGDDGGGFCGSVLVLGGGDALFALNGEVGSLEMRGSARLCWGACTNSIRSDSGSAGSGRLAGGSACGAPTTGPIESRRSAAERLPRMPRMPAWTAEAASCITPEFSSRGVPQVLLGEGELPRCDSESASESSPPPRSDISASCIASHSRCGCRHKTQQRAAG